jgi:hypothetical protein
MDANSPARVREAADSQNELPTRIAQLVVIGLVALLAIRWKSYHWDFHMFVGSAQEFRQGISPYRGTGLSFFQPPLMLYIYSLFTFIPLPAAILSWFAIKLVFLRAMMGLWDKYAVRLTFDWKHILFFLFALNGALYSDFSSGNASVIEQAVLWVGLGAIMTGNVWFGALCIAVMAQLKLTPIFFAVALLVIPAKPRWDAFAACLGMFSAIFSLNFLLQPQLTKNFLAAANVLDERGANNPSLLALIRDSIGMLGRIGERLPKFTDELLFVAIVGVVVWLSWSVVQRVRRDRGPIAPELTALLVTVVFALVAPRFKIYQAIVLLPAALYILKVRPREAAIPLLAAALFMPSAESSLPIRAAIGLLNSYITLVSAFIIWVILLRIIIQPVEQEVVTAQSPGVYPVR